jgi:type I restriction-modification system DNA methylase subunit
VDLAEIESRVAALDTDQGFDLIFALLAAYGFPRASLARLRSGGLNRANGRDECLWKGKVWYRFVEVGEDVHDIIDTAAANPGIVKLGPRFLVVRNRDRLLGLDMRTRATLDVPLAELGRHFEFFLPWAGIEKAQLETINFADIKAAEKMARLYDEVIKQNHVTAGAAVHQLNVFFSRLLFCFFAEDTGVFDESQFTNAIASLTAASGEDTNTFLDELFAVLNTEPTARSGVPTRFEGFGYVNGNLFNQTAPSPVFSAKARRIVLECGTLDWSRINPDIFGSMIQAVVQPGERESLGMHYTSVENIMKVIRPLFLDDLQANLEAADTAGKLERLLDRISTIKVFDPACGSGNFLVIAYKELRRLEHRILERVVDLDPKKRTLFNLSRISLENFYGIEIDDFAHEIAMLSLWLAKHQMNVEFRERFGVEIALIPLREGGNIVRGNAARLDWGEICPALPGEEIYVLGNPPYQGGTKQSSDQKSDVAAAFGQDRVNRYVDYVSIWLVKGARYVMATGAQLGFVTTNSVCQGNHVGLLWPWIERVGAEIAFAHSSFRWSNSAKRNAGVTCVIIGLSRPEVRRSKALYEDGRMRLVAKISPYLKVATDGHVAVAASKTSISGLPGMVFGSMPRDGGHLILEPADRRAILRDHPEADRFIRRLMGSAELIQGIERYCLWIADTDADDAAAIPLIAKRFDQVRAMRRASKAGSTQGFAAQPYRFVQRAHKDTPSVIVPRHSSERREYVPMGFLDQRTVITSSAEAVYDARPWIFALLQSRMHMAWLRAVGGRLETRYRYSAELVYNTFYVPGLAASTREQLTNHALAVLQAREEFPERTLGDLYDPASMPDTLRAAHRALDETVDHLYSADGFDSDETRLTALFEGYTSAVGRNTEVSASA